MFQDHYNEMGESQINPDFDPLDEGPDPEEMEYYHYGTFGKCPLTGEKTDCKLCFPEDRANCERSLIEGGVI